MYLGNKDKIALGFTDFRDIMEKDSLYIDKTEFIELVLSNAAKVQLYCRPNGFGKSTNLIVLNEFLSNWKMSSAIFKRTYIGSSPRASQANKYPVIFLKTEELYGLGFAEFMIKLKTIICKIIEQTLPEEKWTAPVKLYTDCADFFDIDVLRGIIENLHQLYGVKPFLIIDDYDGLLLESAQKGEDGLKARYFLNMLHSALFNNEHLEKAVMTGSIVVNDKALSGAFIDADLRDTAFGLAELEFAGLVTEQNSWEKVKWWSDVCVHPANVYSVDAVLRYLHDKHNTQFETVVGNNHLVRKLLVDKIMSKVRDHYSKVTEQKGFIKSSSESKITVEDLVNRFSEEVLYKASIQLGYMPIDPTTITSDSFYRTIAHKGAPAVWEIISQFAKETQMSKE